MSDGGCQCSKVFIRTLRSPDVHLSLSGQKLYVLQNIQQNRSAKYTKIEMFQGLY